MTDSKRLAGLIGPALMALSVTEAVNIDVFANQMAPVIYLNGAILFVTGLAIVRAHNLWTWGWPVLVTLTGWAALLGGFLRMAAPNAPQAADSFFTYAVLAVIAAIGAVLSVIAYGPKARAAPKPSDV